MSNAQPASAATSAESAAAPAAGAAPPGGLADLERAAYRWALGAARARADELGWGEVSWWLGRAEDPRAAEANLDAVRGAAVALWGAIRAAAGAPGAPPV